MTEQTDDAYLHDGPTPKPVTEPVEDQAKEITYGIFALLVLVDGEMPEIPYAWDELTTAVQRACRLCGIEPTEAVIEKAEAIHEENHRIPIVYKGEGVTVGVHPVSAFIDVKGWADGLGEELHRDNGDVKETN